MSSTTYLNLARKWRSQQFEQVIGQDLSVRILKNSLYLDHLFPVYLFAGQRGCGKTSTARIFASAINCEQFHAFKADPKNAIIPCLNCLSCRAMQEGKHPDFIEMDAASHTGVDNVRSIIDAASLMPIMGRKKIYLIDEAHMLSKPALNAFLKILEEPPASVLFILATTDAQKIIETVRSRCFQLFFKSIEVTTLEKHLENICIKEDIAYEKEGLILIVKESQGSARDALNMLESVRFSSACISKEAVIKILGHVDQEYVVKLLEHVLSGQPDKLLAWCKRLDASEKTVMFVWQQFVQLLHACIWLKHGVKPDVFTDYLDHIKVMIAPISWSQLYAYVTFCYQQEQILLKTTNQHAFLVMIMLHLATMRFGDNEPSSGVSSMSHHAASKQISPEDDAAQQDDDEGSYDIPDDASDFKAIWYKAVADIVLLDDPLVTSIFKQATCTMYDQSTGVLQIAFGKGFTFFQDLLENSKHIWSGVIKKHFGDNVVVTPLFTQEQPLEQPARTKEVAHMQPKAEPTIVKPLVNRPSTSAMQQPFVKKNSYQSYTKKRIDQVQQRLVIDDKNSWPKAQMLLSYFPGELYHYSTNEAQT